MLSGRTNAALLFLLFSLLYSRAGLAQIPDSSFWARHSFHRSDSALAYETGRTYNAYQGLVYMGLLHPGTKCGLGKIL